MNTKQISKKHWRVRLLKMTGESAKTQCGLFWKSNAVLLILAILALIAAISVLAAGVWTAYILGDFATTQEAEAATNIVMLFVYGVSSLTAYVGACCAFVWWAVACEKKYSKMVWNFIAFPFRWVGKMKEKAKAAFMEKFCKKIEYID